MQRHDGPATAGFTVRLPWAQLDGDIRCALDTAICGVTGSTVVRARDVHGGMSPGPAGVLTTEDGQSVFVKLTSSEVNERSSQLYREEIAAYGALSDLDLPMPQLLTTVDHGPWVGLVLTVAPGRTPGPPWNRSALSDVADACATVNATTAPAALPPVLQRLPSLDGWQALCAEPPVLVDGWRPGSTRPSLPLTSWPRG